MTSNQPPSIKRHKLVVLVWLGLYPLLTLITYVTGPFLAGLPIPLRTLVTSLILVPIMVYLLLPTITKRFATWLSK
jgi:hypothetical protein